MDNSFHETANQAGGRQGGKDEWQMFVVLLRLCRLGIAAAGGADTMKDAAAEVAMAGADAVASELVQQL